MAFGIPEKKFVVGNSADALCSLRRIKQGLLWHVEEETEIGIRVKHLNNCLLYSCFTKYTTHQYAECQSHNVRLQKIDRLVIELLYDHHQTDMEMPLIH